MCEIHSVPLCRLQSYFAQAFDRINCEFFIIHCICPFLGPHLPVQQPYIDHSCVNWVTEHSNLPFFGSHLSEKSPCISVEQVNILEVAAVHRYNSWFCYFYMILFIPMLLPHVWFGPFSKIVMRDIVIFKYNSKNIYRMKLCGILLWKTIWLLSQILSSWKSSVWNCVSLCCINTVNCLFKQILWFVISNRNQFLIYRSCYICV